MTSPTQAAGDFAALQLNPSLLAALAAKNHTTPTPIQAQAIPALLAKRDLLGLAQTGTGKTYAFALPMLHQLAASKVKPQRGVPRALVLAPTRELAVQIADNIAPLAKTLKLRFSVVMGGVSRYVQTQVMAQGLDVLIATPGRLMDLIRDRHATLGDTHYFVIDEADRMLDMGFIRDVRAISKMLPEDCQSALFSATMPREIEQFAQELLDNPVRIQVASKTVAVEAIHQEVRFVAQPHKLGLLKHLLADSALEKVVVFARTKYGADKIVRGLDATGIATRAIHGNKSQGQRQNALQAFRDGKARVLIATDIAARGIDVPGITHVINYDLPMDAENYLHRIGRTGRAGATGASISFCDGSERSILKNIEKLMKQAIAVNPDVPAAVKAAAANAAPEKEVAYVDPRRKPEHRRGGPRKTGSDGGPRKTGSDGGPRLPKVEGERNYGPKSDRPRTKRPAGERSSDGRSRTEGRSSWKPEFGPSDRSDRRPRDGVQRDYAGRDASGRASEFDSRERKPAAHKPRGFAGKPGGVRSEHRSDSRPDGQRGPRKPFKANVKSGGKARGPRAA